MLSQAVNRRLIILIWILTISDCSWGISIPTWYNFPNMSWPHDPYYIVYHMLVLLIETAVYSQVVFSCAICMHKLFSCWSPTSFLKMNSSHSTVKSPEQKILNILPCLQLPGWDIFYQMRNIIVCPTLNVIAEIDTRHRPQYGRPVSAKINLVVTEKTRCHALAPH